MLTANGLTLLFIGRQAQSLHAWHDLRRLCQPSRAFCATQAHQGMAILAKNPGLKLAVVAVDDLCDSEMSFFAAARRCRPDLYLLALGVGDELSNPRLAKATWEGAQETANFQSLFEKVVNRLQRSADAAGLPIPTKPAKTEIPQGSPALPETHAKKDAPDEIRQAVVENFLQARNVAESRRKGPPAEQAPTPPRKTQDVVSPEELRVLLGQDDPPSDSGE